MGRCLVSSTPTPLRFSQISRSISLFNRPKLTLPSSSFAIPHLRRGFRDGFCKTLSFNSMPTRTLCTKAVLSEIPNQKKYSKVASESTGPISSNQLLGVVETAAKTGAEVVMDAVKKPQNIVYKGLTDLVTDTDKMSEVAILEVVTKNFKDHLILGEEGGLIGNSSSDYLWCIDPLDGTTNFAHCYPSFAVSVGVLYKGKPAAGAVVEFVGGPMCWNTRTFSAAAGGGAFCNGQKIQVSHTDKRLVEDVPNNTLCFMASRLKEFFHELYILSDLVIRLHYGFLSTFFVSPSYQFLSQAQFMQGKGTEKKVEQSLLVTGFGYEHDDAWSTNIELFKEFTDVSRGVRRLGAAAVDMCHVALGIVEAYWEYGLKPWDMAAGVLIVEEAGGVVSCMDGGKYSVFDRSVLVSNGVLHDKRIGPPTDKLKNKGIDFSLWFKPENYHTDC
ncbi:hypothetical protein TEA_006846 [Camellia sinensis var. sinensis]|uniref:inositol-phosphate phosphatase n=1 Tax=Camellia sinensis var. sinensis TaxID=542762 RepID=A0A4S4EN08_CAMSN|nr:hypothetical protein TEA_006846 [Camellia sinensis var. sinensis]